MPKLLVLFAALPMFAGCASGEWVVTTWGEEYIEDGIPAAEFVDGCEATYDVFEVEFTSASLLTVTEELVVDVPPARIDLTDAGPHELGVFQVRADTYERVYYEIGPAGGSAVRAAGTLTCAGQSVSFDWSFEESSRYRCLPLEVTVPSNDRAVTELTIHGDHLFFDDLDEDGGDLRGEAIVAADADADGVVTLAELESVDVASAGYGVSTYTDVTNLADFVDRLVLGVGHVDGEGHCFVDG